MRTRFAVQSFIIVLSAVFGEAQQKWPSQSFKTENFTAPSLAVNRTEPTAPGYLFLGPVGPLTTVSAPIIMTDTNELVWHGPTSNPQNFRTQALDGKSVLSYWNGFGASGQSFGHGYGSVEILDDTYKSIHNICGPQNFVTYNATLYPGNEPHPCFLDNHESYITDRNTIIVTAYNVTQTDLRSVGGSRRGWAFDAQFYELDVESEKVIFSWKHFEHLDQIPFNASNYLNRTGRISPLNLNGTLFGKSQSLPWDPFHINAIQPLGDGYLVNSRFYWSTFYVSKRDGSVLWNFNGGQAGSFRNGPRVSFQWQHDVRAPDGFADIERSLNLTLHDNANEPLPEFDFKRPTRGLKVNINMRTKRTTLLRELADPSDPVYNPAQGSYQTLDGQHVLIGYGTIAKVKEFDAAGNVVYSAQFGNITNMLPPPVTNYRALKQAWSATPYYKPKIRTEANADNDTSLYMSWNGATDYDSWKLYAGRKRSELEPLATVRRKGFETRYTFKAGLNRFLLAEARNGNKSLRNSTIVKL